MEHQAAYEKHLQFMQNVYAIDDIDEKDLCEQFDLLLSCIPNGGKLYKYRSLCGRSFKYIYDSLVNGYLWLPTAKTLNDDNDSVLIANAETASRHFVDSITRDHDRAFYVLLMQLGEKYWKEDPLLSDIPFNTLLAAFDPITGAMDNQKMVELFSAHANSADKLDHFRLLARHLLDDLQNALHITTKDLFLANDSARENYHVYSMAESFDLGNMWGYYADSGQGFCIEYDYAKAKNLGVTAMRYLLNTFKVIYSDVPREIPIELLAESSFFNPNDKIVKDEIMRSVLERVLSKDKCWEHEKEWRIVLGNTDCKMPVDIVSAIIIDERSLEKTNAKKLIRLCRKRGWPVKVRKNHICDTSHSYEDLTEKGDNNE